MLAGALLIGAAVLWTSPGPGAAGSTATPSVAASLPGASAARSATPAPTATPSPLPTPTPAPTPRVVAATGLDLTWRAVASLPGTASDPASQTVVASALSRAPGGAYVAVGEIVDGFLTETGATGPVHPALWTSSDGVAWRLADARGLGGAVPSAAASDGKLLLVVVSDSAGTRVLRTSDLATWTAVTPAGSRVARIVAGGPGFVALGARTATGGSAIWTTRDGSSWRLAWESTASSAEELGALARAPSGQMLAGGLQLRPAGGVRAAAVASRDGVTWQTVAAASLPPTMGFDAIGTGADGAWYGSGYDDDAGGIGIWRSVDGAAWQPTTFGPGQLTELPGDTGSAREVFGFDRATFVLAYTSCCGDPPQRTLVSRDARTWTRADRSAAVREVRITDLLVEGGRVLAIGGLNRGAGVWAATAAPTTGVELPTELSAAAEANACTADSTSVRVRLVADRSGAVVRIRLERLDESADFGPIVWPFGWSAVPGPPLVLRDRSGTKVATEGDELTFDGGAVIGGSYHVCRIDGQPATTR